MAKPASRNADRPGGASRRGSSIFTGVLIGLAVGAVLAVGVALWVTGNNPFQSKPAESAVVKAAPTPDVPEAAPSFDFYKVLPGDAPSDLPPPAASTAPAAMTYYLQAGAFQNADDADNLKAQLALLGVEAAIQTSDLGDKGVFHRVRVGPFDSEADLNSTRNLLSQNSIPATLVKESPPTQETP
jgi:cell division protein FtsN